MTKPTGRRPGRPSAYTPEIGNEICERIANGESLQAICRDPRMPRRQMVLRYLDADPDFRAQYIRAREAQADLLAEQVIEIADKATAKTALAARLRFDARRWYAGKVAPKKYGEKITSEHTGPDGGPIETKELSDLDAVRRINFLLRKAASAPSKEKP